jgi:tetratricopeptide (TPR) repeat protein
MADQKPSMQVVGRLDVSKEAGPPRWDPATADPILARGGEAMQAGDLDAAEAAFKEAHDLSRPDPRPLGGLALIAMQRKDWSSAVAYGREAASRRDAGYEVFYNLGFSLLQVGKRDDAIDAWHLAFQADPTQPHAIHQLVSHGRIPRLEGQEALTEAQPLDTLSRLELYDSVGRAVHHEEADGTFRHTVEWAIERGAPWGRIAAWLARQGVHDDGSLIEVLSARDAHLADSWVSGFLIAAGPQLRLAAQQNPDFGLLVDGGAVDPKGKVIFAKLDVDGSRAVLPPQRTSAAHVVGLAQHLFPVLGPQAALVITVDPATHLGPRRLWIITPSSDTEVIAAWKGTLEDGADAPAQALPDDRVLPAAASPLYVPGTDRASLQALIDEHLLQEVVRAVDPDGMAEFDADRVADYAAAWAAFLGKVAAHVPPGSAVLPRWREGSRDVLAICRPGAPVARVTLRSVWPGDPEEFTQQVPMDLQFLGRALFQGPRPKGPSADG